MDITEADVEHVARAIVEAHGFDPDELVLDIVLDMEAHSMAPPTVPRWILVRMQASTHIAAFRACRELDAVAMQGRQHAAQQAMRKAQRQAQPKIHPADEEYNGL